MARKIGFKNLKKQVPVIIGAGLTEQYYFTHLRNITDYKFKILPRFFGTESLYKLEQKIDQVLENNRVAICVFDADIAARDDIEREKLTNFLVKYIGNENVIICDSLPSIEYWFLIHYTETQKRFTSKELISALRKFIVGFDKKEKFLKNEKWVKNLCKDDKLSLAIERSKKPVPKNYSYSNVYRAFLNIKK